MVHKDKLKGGVGDKINIEDVDINQLSIGTQIEMEHSNDDEVARSIALDHLAEDPDYYTKLVRAGLAKEFQPSTNSGFGDPDNSINDLSRLGSDVTCTAGNNVVGRIGNTPNGQIQGKNNPPIVDKNIGIDIDIQEPSFISESPEKLELKNRTYPWYSGITFFVYKTPSGKINYVSSSDSGIDLTVKINGMDFSRYIPMELRTHLDHENLVEILYTLNEKLINKNLIRRDFIVSGRLWKVNNQNYISFWNEKGNIQKSVLDKLMSYLNVTYDNTLFEFPSNQKDYKSYDQSDMKFKSASSIDLTPHLSATGLPKSYDRELRRLKSLNERNLQLLEGNTELAQSDITKIIDYSQKLQSMFNVDDNLEDWIKAKLNHASDYVSTVRDYQKFYQDARESLHELLKESVELEKKYKDVIDSIQYALDIVGVEPTVGSAADITNVIISLLRAALSKEKDESKKHLLNSAISAVSIIPFGDIAKLIKIRALRKPTVKLLRFIKNYLKTSSPSYIDNLLEKYSTVYKKSINCSSPHGFNQKLQCRIKHSKIKSSKEIILELLKEQNSSMSMGVLKQLNSDAKELQGMIQPDTHLEDWVKSKLNLAGEYLDDVYHHLDHFGSDIKNPKTSTDKIKEGYDGGYKDDDVYYNKDVIDKKDKFLKFISTSSQEKKYWVTPDAKIVDVGHSHESWIEKNDRSLKGRTLIDTYDNAIKRGYIRLVLDIRSNFLMLSNLENYDFVMHGNSSRNIPPVKSKSLDVIKDFIVEKEIEYVATGKGNIIKDLSHLDENSNNKDPVNEEITKTFVDHSKIAIDHLKILSLIKSKFRKKDDIAKAIRLVVEKQNVNPNYLTSSSIKSILIGLGERNNFSDLNSNDKKLAEELRGLSSVALTHNDGILIKVLDLINPDHLNEDLKKILGSVGLAAGLTTMGLMGVGQSSASIPNQSIPPIEKTQVIKNVKDPSVKSDEIKLLNGKLSDYIAHWEGKKNKAYKDSSDLLTIGIGHYLTNTDEDHQLFKSLFGTSVDYNKILSGEQILTDNQIEKLFNVDVKIKEKLANKKISGFGSLPQYVKNAIINALYRGDLGPKTISLMNKGDWSAADKEYLNHRNVRSGPSQIVRRMKTNASSFSHYASQI